jgi:hypothetical protein
MNRSIALDLKATLKALIENSAWSHGANELTIAMLAY